MAYNQVTQEEAERFVLMYATGLSSNEVGKLVGRDGRLVRKWLAEAGVLRERDDAVRMATETRGRWDLFDTWTEESAWVLGLLFGDGHLAKDGTGNAFTLAGSLQVCGAVAEILQSDAVLIDRGTYALLRWSSWRMAESVRARFGIGGNKARTMRFPEVPEEMLPHFVRGLWDADGGWGRRGRSLRANYACSSPDFVRSLCEVLRSNGWDPRVYERLTPLNGKKYLGYRIELLAAHSRELATWLYKTASVACARKKVLALGGSL